MKSEPDAYSWQHLLDEGHTWWDGVRNYQANNNMKAMQVGDEALFYHSVSEKRIVGVMRISDAWRLDPTDDSGRFGMVGIKPVCSLDKPVTLATIKETPELAGMALLKQSRLSVAPVTGQEWQLLLSMAK